jgi:hypothetical protein
VFGASGTLGVHAFSNATLTFTLEADTANVFHFSVSPQPGYSVTGYENLYGKASLDIVQAQKPTHLIANISPSAGIFAAVDNTNQSLGFGSFGTPPSTSAIPTYPGGMVFDPDLITYKLKSNIDTYRLSGGQLYAFLSCIGFPDTSSCQAPVPLKTSGGDLLIDPSPCCEVCCAEFSATLHPMLSFASLDANVIINGPDADNFMLSASFTLASNSNGVLPLTDTFTLKLGKYVLILPPGSFKRGQSGYIFKGTVRQIPLSIKLMAVGTQEYALEASGSDVPSLRGTGSSLPVTITVGDDTGTTTATVAN